MTLEPIQIDRDFMELYLNDSFIGSLFAKSENISGEFFLEGLDIRISISDSEMDKVIAAKEMLAAIKTGRNNHKSSSEEIESARLIYATFMQTHNHELAHLYQVLALPAFQMVWATRYNLLRFEAAVMLKHFEQGGYFQGDTHCKILQVLDDGNPALTNEFARQFNDFANPYKMYISDYRKQYEGISLFNIIEAMAHIISLQLSDTPEDDPLQLAVSEEYSAAFLCFDSYLHKVDVDLRWKYFVFIYICYFSCHHFNTDVTHPINTAVSCFLSLCSKARFYIETLANLYQRYEHYSISELKALNQWSLTDEELNFANQKQLAGIYALFEFIQILEKQAFAEKFPHKSLTVNALADFFTVSDAKNINWEDKFTLARMLIFPANFVWTREIYDEVMGLVRTDKEYSYAQEAMFYRFIVNCNHLLQPFHKVACCDEHGMRDQRKKVIRCKNEGSLAFYLNALTDKPAYELFRF